MKKMTIKEKVLKEIEKNEDYISCFDDPSKHIISLTLAEVEKVIDESITSMGEMYKMIKHEKKLSEHDRGWENCSQYLKGLKQKLGLDSSEVRNGN